MAVQIPSIHDINDLRNNFSGNEYQNEVLDHIISFYESEIGPRWVGDNVVTCKGDKIAGFKYIESIKKFEVESFEVGLKAFHGGHISHFDSRDEAVRSIVEWLKIFGFSIPSYYPEEPVKLIKTEPIPSEETAKRLYFRAMKIMLRIYLQNKIQYLRNKFSK
jgi:hypothetical protein